MSGSKGPASLGIGTKTLVVPETIEEVDSLLATLYSQYGSFPIQSQHEGNCASDSIQIVMFFADGIRNSYIRRALMMYKFMGDRVFQGHNQVVLNVPPNFLQNRTPAERNSVIDSCQNYITTAIQRYIKLVASMPSKIRRHGAFGGIGMLRAESEPNTYRGQDYGVTCSYDIGNIAITLGVVTQSNMRTHRRSYSYAYAPESYVPLIEFMLHNVHTTPDSGEARLVRGTGPIGGQRALLQAAGYGRGAQLVGVQVFLHSRQGYFHTFVLVKHSDTWYIGDNEVGLIKQTTFTDDDILGDTIQFRSSLFANGPPKIHRREYRLNGKEIQFDYAGTEGTGVAYDVSDETAYTSRGGNHWGIRNYFLYTPAVAAPPTGATSAFTGRSSYGTSSTSGRGSSGHRTMTPTTTASTTPAFTVMRPTTGATSALTSSSTTGRGSSGHRTMTPTSTSTGISGNELRRRSRLDPTTLHHLLGVPNQSPSTTAATTPALTVMRPTTTATRPANTVMRPTTAPTTPALTVMRPTTAATRPANTVMRPPLTKYVPTGPRRGGRFTSKKKTRKSKSKKLTQKRK
jgi:hypothetical protein